MTMMIYLGDFIELKYGKVCLKEKDKREIFLFFVPMVSLKFIYYLLKTLDLEKLDSSSAVSGKSINLQKSNIISSNFHQNHQL